MEDNIYWRKVGTRKYGDQLLGFIGMAQHVSLKTLAQATNTSVSTVMRQMYLWAYLGENLKLLRRVNWKWNRAQQIPVRFLREFEGRPINADERFAGQVARELHRQAQNDNEPRVHLLLKVLEDYAV